MADNGTFLKSGGLIQVDQQGGTVNVNGANTLKGNITLTGANSLTLDVNKNQSAVGVITLGTGTLTLAVDAAVTSIAFADNSGATWGSGSVLAITGAADNEISFGSDANGLTNAQLAKVTLGGSTPAINGQGQLGSPSVIVSTFNNGGGDNLWSNAANWSAMAYPLRIPQKLLWTPIS